MKSSPQTPIVTSRSAFRLPRRPKAVVFDLDGTLIDSEALVLDAYMAAANRHGVPAKHGSTMMQPSSSACCLPLE